MGEKQQTKNPKTLKKWEIIDSFGKPHHFTAHYCFDNGEDGLVVRRHINDNPENYTDILAVFAKGGWVIYKDITNA